MAYIELLAFICVIVGWSMVVWERLRCPLALPWKNLVRGTITIGTFGLQGQFFFLPVLRLFPRRIGELFMLLLYS